MKSPKTTDWAWRLASLGPLVLILFALTLLPIGYIAVMSFHAIEWRGGRLLLDFVGFANYAALIDGPLLGASFRNTIVFVVVASTAEMVLGFTLAFMVSRLTRGRIVFLTIFLLPILVPPIIIGAIWKLMYNFDLGLINDMIAVIGLAPQDWLGNRTLALASVIVVDIWHWTPFTFLLLLAGIESLPKEVGEAAKMDGASVWQELRYVVVPMMVPVIVVTLVTRTLLAFKVFDEVFLLTSGGPGTTTEVLSFTVFRIFFQEDRQGAGSAMSVMIIVFVTLIVVVGITGVAGYRRRTQQT